MVQLSGELILAEDIVPVRFFRKIATETVTASTTFQDDDDISGIALAANKIYRVELIAGASATGTGDLKTQWVLGGGSTALVPKVAFGPSAGTTDHGDTTVRMTRTNVATPVGYGLSSVGGLVAVIWEEFLIETTTLGTAGTLTLQWAQNSSNLATSMTTATYCIVTEVEAG